MYKAVIFYFSGTGNTWWVADKIKKQLDSKNINADIVSIDSVDRKKANWWIKTADLVFFGWPVYGSDLPEPMKQFIDGLMVINKGKHIHTFCTQMMFSGDGAWLYHKNFEDKGLIIDSAVHFIMPSNVSVLRLLGPPKSDEKIAKIMEKCGKHVEKHVEGLLMGKVRIQGKHSGLLGILQRVPYRLFFKRFRNLVGVDKSLCTRCGLCEKLCPSANIKMNEYPEFAGQCALCMRCYAFCPEYAITYKGRPRNVEKKGKPYILHDKRFKPAMLK
ncbi:MAG: EFR1 family ferrodoxin [Eubacteriales bacterium]|nr:EFR1 family ferrodoxin [Eubacteriales bacterium]